MKTETKTHLETLQDIRQMMDKSSRFISLSGLSGVFAGIYALIGATLAYLFLFGDKSLGVEFYSNVEGESKSQLIKLLLFIAFLVASLSIFTGIFLTTRKAHKDGTSLFDSSAKRLIINFCIPLFSGGMFCFLLMKENLFYLIVPSMLIFYGLSLVHASKYTLGHIRYLGFVEMGLGFICGFINGNGLFFWAIGFGFCHIVYGIYMHFKLEK